jgi:hypothetical protein
MTNIRLAHRLYFNKQTNGWTDKLSEERNGWRVSQVKTQTDHRHIGRDINIHTVDREAEM